MKKTTRPARTATRDTFHLDQIPLVTAIMKEVERQFRQAKLPPPACVPFRVQAIIDGANGVVAAWKREEIKATPLMGLSAWLKCDDRGLSSDAMCWAIYGPVGGLEKRTNHPRDPDDFGRCYRFVQAIPVPETKFEIIALLSPVWRELMINWRSLVALYLEELPTGSAPKLYARMKELGC